LRYKLGKRPARHGAVKFKFADYFNAEMLPPVPAIFGHYSLGCTWGMLANDRYGDCVWAGAAHETMVWNHEVGGSVGFSDREVLADYSAVTGFDPTDPATDQGTDMTAAASYRRKTGVVDALGKRHQIDSYVALNPGDANQLALATYLFGAVGVGIRLPSSAEQQFDNSHPWTVFPGTNIVGGHYIPCIGRNSAGDFLIVTWGRLHAMTPEFYATYCDEVVAYVSLEPLKNKLSPEGFDVNQLKADLAALTGQPKESVAMPDVVQGTSVDQGEIDAVFASIKNLADEKVPGWERGMISDDLLRQVAAAAVTASVQYRTGKSI
jgi:hypothetical protein